MYVAFIEPCFGIGHNLSLICQMTSEDIKHQLIIIMSLTPLPVAVLGRQYTVEDGVPWSFVCVSVFIAIKEVTKITL